MPRHPTVIVLVVLGVVACGSSQEPGTDGARRSTTRAEPDDDDDGMIVEGLRGTLQRDEVDPVMNRAVRRFQQCYVEAYADHPYLVGELSLHFTIGSDGSVQTVWTPASTLGARDVEACILAIARGLVFPRPHGGSEAEFDYGPLEMSSDDHHPFDEWTAADLPGGVEDGGPAIADAIAEIEGSCLGGTSGFAAILWVGPGGAVRSIGVVAPSASLQDHARCLERSLAELVFPDPGSGRIAKLTLEF